MRASPISCHARFGGLDGQVVSDTVRDRGAPVDGAVAEAGVQSLLAQTANPEAPNEVSVGQPSDVLTARAAAAGAGGVVGRHRLGHPDRRIHRPDAGRSSVSDAAYLGIANGM